MNRIAAIFLMGMIVLTSCQRNRIMTGLEDIGSYIQRRPDRALGAIRSVGIAGLNNGELHALPVSKTQSDHFKHAMASMRQKKTILRQRYILAIFIIVVVSSAAIFFLIRSKNLISKEKDRLRLAMDESERMSGIMRHDFEDKYSAMKEESAAHERKVAELQRMYACLYRRQFSEIGKYCDASFDCNPERASQKITRQVAAEISLVLSEVSVRHGNLSKFEDRLNRDADNIIAKIRKDYPRYSEDDIRFICYVVAGFDATTISVLMNMTGENARVKKHRIRMRLMGNTGENAELYRLWFA